MVYIKEIDKNVFPSYIKPLENELFSSWLCRLSFSHDVKPISFIHNLFGRGYPIWNRDIDMLAPPFLIQKIFNHTPLNLEEINNLFLTSYQTEAYLKRNHNGLTNHIIPLGIKHRKRKRFGQLFCPSCLKQEIPYYRKKWRLLTSLVCIDCNTHLRDRCQKCQKPITFFRVNMSNQNISVVDHRELRYCSECGHDLSDNLRLSSKTTENEVKWQRFVDNTISNGYNSFSSYSFLFFRGVFILTKRLRSNTKNNLFKRIVDKELNTTFSLIQNDLRYWSIEDRRETFNVVYSLLEQFPNRLSSILEKGNVTMTKIYGERERIPYWLENIIIHRDKKTNPFTPY